MTSNDLQKRCKLPALFGRTSLAGAPMALINNVTPAMSFNDELMP